MRIKMAVLLAISGIASEASAQETTTYTYDALGRLVESKVSGSRPTVTTGISYDPAGNRKNYTVKGGVDAAADTGASAGIPSTKRFVVVPLNGFTVIPIN